MTKTFFLATLLILTLTACGCGERDCEYKIYCGASIPDGGTVSEADWRDFCARTVATAFPAGFTAVDAVGYFGSGDSPVPQREETRVIIVVAPATPETRAKIRAIAAAYKQRFRQGSVLVTRAPLAEMAFE